MTRKPADAEVVVLAQEIEFEMDSQQRPACPIEKTTPELYFCDDLQGYAWCFRKGNFLNIGLGREGETRLSMHVDAFVDRLVRRGRIPPGLAQRFHGHAYRLYLGPPRSPTCGRVLLIGDAAGLAYPQSGEGIRPAIESGLLAASTILETPPDRRDELAVRLERRLARRFGRRGRGHKAAGLVPASWRRFAARRLLASPWFARRILIDRWFLHRHEPALKLDDVIPDSLPTDRPNRY